MEGHGDGVQDVHLIDRCISCIVPACDRDSHLRGLTPVQHLKHSYVQAAAGLITTHMHQGNRVPVVFY